jgi:hypothetical protein
MYNQGETVIVTEKISKTENKHSVGVIMNKFSHKKQTFYDVLLERRSVLTFLNTARSSKHSFINRDLSKKLVDTGEIETTIPFKYMVDNEQLPIIIA